MRRPTRRSAYFLSQTVGSFRDRDRVSAPRPAVQRLPHYELRLLVSIWHGLVRLLLICDAWQQAGNGIRPDIEPVTLQLNTFTTTIPAGSFIKAADGSYVLLKVINGVFYNCYIRPQGGSTYEVHMSGTSATIPPTTNPVVVRPRSAGDDSGLASVDASIN